MKHSNTPNGPFKVHLQKIEGSLDEIKDDLSKAVKDHSTAVRDLTIAVHGLTHNISMWDRAVPIKLVVIMFGVVVVTVGGIEAIKAYIKLVLGT